jgi:hypothetical protein
MRKMLFCCVVSLFAATLSPGQTVSPSSQCMAESHPHNLCRWSASTGTAGRVCRFDVEAMDQKEACHFEATVLSEPDDHPPICISATNKEHIVFHSSKKRNFRVRRMVRMNERNAAGQLCPEHPFRRHFEPAELKNFGTEHDTDVVDAAPEGCMYKFEVQFHKVDRNAPEESYDPQHTRYECRDPHIKIIGQSSAN